MIIHIRRPTILSEYNKEAITEMLSSMAVEFEIIDPAPISNQTCRLCRKKDACLPYRFLGYILCTDSRFVESKDHDDLYLHLGELCKKHEFIEWQEG